ncbi:MAG TPA: Wzz/FepE/Etk N-terminal domain-containing protein [Trebonia sp.]|jgi:capsular polysaccharide biosynthesis protein|nr:Wzz/FepE/Etk N-terminal domain-containing protein [Trebonia sp.]
MSQQPMNLRRSVQIVRRHKFLVSAVTVLGLIVGVGYATVKGPTYTSHALVVIPSQSSGAAASSSAAAGGAPGGDDDANSVDTQVVIATSAPVLAKALPAIHPAIGLDALQNQVSASSPAAGVISISASAKTAAGAESEANAIATAYIAYIGAKDSPVGQLSARPLQSASMATGQSPAKTYGIDGGLGLIVGLLLGIVTALVTSRRDRKLRTLDDIASALGVPVVAALPVEHPADAAGWSRLLDNYDPPAVHAWRLRQVLQGLDMGGRGERDRPAGPATLAVLSVTTDPDALALGPQLASFAASLGIPTVLVMGPQQDSNATAALHTACAGWSGGSGRSSHLRALVADGGRFSVPNGARLVVLLLALDAKQSQLPQTMPATSTLVAVSAGGATAEQLARIATAAAADGRDVSGIMVADPESADQSTGRLAQQPGRNARGGPHPAPAYPDEVPTEIRR